MRKTILVSALALMSVSSFADTSIPNVKGQFKVTANVAAGCDIAAANINFGVLAMPIQNVSASADLDVKCSNKASYTIGITYADAIGSAESGEYTIVPVYALDNTNNEYYIYKNGQRITGEHYYDIDCYTNAVQFENVATLELFGYTGKYYPTESVYDVDVFNKFCNGSNARINESSVYEILGQYGVGKLVGVSAGETIKYSLEVPSNASLTWNQNNKYQGVGNGDHQKITMKANIKSADNPTHRMTPDTYISTLTAQITY